MTKMVRLFVFFSSKYRTMICVFTIFLMSTGACTNSYSKPPSSLEKVDLLGVWEATYSQESIDRITLKENHFQQTYRDPETDFGVNGNAWRLERLPSGFVRIYLPGARYYALGVDNSNWLPSYDPFIGDDAPVIDELVLQVVIDSAGNLVLRHLSLDPDEGIPMFGEDRALFHRVVTP
jgi:hypothetical protein